MAVRPIPEGYHTATPYLMIAKGSGAEAIEFYRRAFGAAELMRMPGPDGGIVHAEIRIGDSPIMMAEECPGFSSPQTLGGAGISLMLYVEDVDASFEKAVAAGATVQRPLQNQFYGDRSATLADPFGHVWSIASHVEDVSPEEIERRFAEMMQQQGGA